MSHFPPVPTQRVLPTLNQDGTRRWVRPKVFHGTHYWRRFAVAWSLIAVFVALPFVKIAGYPAILLDVPGRKFHLFGATFLPTDGVLLMFLLLAIFLTIFWISALAGRVWCGWGCPQTAYMEFLFRPIERLLEGSRGQQLKLDRDGANFRRVLKLLIYGLLAIALGNLFLSYFVGVDRLKTWLTRSPFEHPTPFLVAAFTSALVFYDFAYFREQMCTIICPYARLQSVLLDRRSLLIGYDEKRGEPRGKGRKVGGDCIDCKACVVACPTGIDIRQGLQLECIACAQCVDACNSVMRKIKKPEGLIRYGSQAGFAGEAPSKRVRARLLLYPALVSLCLLGLVLVGSNRRTAELTVLRGIGAPFAMQGEQVRNQLRIKLRNRGDEDVSFQLSLDNAEDSEFIAPENPVFVKAGEQVTASAFVISPPNLFHRGVRTIEVIARTENGLEKRAPYKLLGPMTQSGPGAGEQP
jgi:cytochrome c oxidase accessory protein FixG